MGIIIKGDVKGDIIAEGGVKNETHYHYGNEHKIEHGAQNSETHEETVCQNTINVAQNTLSPSRQTIVNDLQDLIDKGQWLEGMSAEVVKTTMLNMLKDEHADVIWQLLERGSGDRLRVVWQNMIGYFAYYKLLPNSCGAPALNEMFFGDKIGTDNINKGKPSYKDCHMSKSFQQALSLLDKYFLPLAKSKR